MIQDEFSNKYREWCIVKEVDMGTESIIGFHRERKCPIHDKCNYCKDGAMNK